MSTTELKTVTPVRGRELLPVCWLAEDERAGEAAARELEHAGFPVLMTADAESALDHIQHGMCRAVVVESAENNAAMEFLERAVAADPGMHVILVCAVKTMDAAVEAIKRGAYDYLGQPADWARLLRTLDELAHVAGQRRRVRELEQQMLADLEFYGVVGKSPAILAVFEMARKVAKHYSNMLLSGPTGAGKELVARAIHKMSPGASGHFAVCNCSAIGELLLESKLFGHMREAFAGATETREGAFEFVSGGTVFLDGVDEMSSGTQAKLLRVIQNREIQRVGSPEVRKVDARLIVATNRDLRQEVAAGRFREDLYYRLSSLEIRVPGLVERLEDIALLVQFFLKRYNQEYGRKIQGLTRRAQVALLRHDWPGNVRELENAIAGAALLADGNFIDLDDLPESFLRQPGAKAHAGEQWRPVSLEAVKRAHIQRVLELCEGNRVQAAQLLGIGRTSLYRHLKRNGGSHEAKAAQV